MAPSEVMAMDALQQIGVQFKRVGASWRANCPFCFATGSLEVKPSKPSKWFCHACCDRHPYDAKDIEARLGGKLVLAQNNGNIFAREFSAMPDATAYAGLSSYFKTQRQFPDFALDDAVKLAGKYLKYDMGYYKEGEYVQGGNFLVAPVFDLSNPIKREIIGVQRLSTSARKFKNPHGRTGGGFSINCGSKEIVIVESVINAICLGVAGISSVCIFSVNNAQLIPGIVRHLSAASREKRQFYLFFDSADDGSHVDAHVERAISACPELIPVTFYNKPSGYDINDLLTDEGELFSAVVGEMLTDSLSAKLKLAGVSAEQVLASFPLDVLPPWLAAYIEELSLSTQAPRDYFVGALFPVLGSALGNKKTITHPPKNWQERACFYSAIVGSSSSGKSVAVDAISKPIFTVEAEFAERNNALRDAFDQEMFSWGLEKSAVAAKSKKGLPASLPAKPSAPCYQRARTTNATVEALHSILENNSSVLLEHDEISGWIHGMNAYRRAGCDREFFLSNWSGKAFTVDRKSQEKPIYVKSPHVCVVGSTTVSKLGLLVSDETSNDGLTARILFVCPPEQPSPRSNSAVVSRDLAAQWHELILRLYEKREIAQEWPLTVAAQQMFAFCYDSISDWIDNESSEVKKSWLGKSRGQILRFALVLAVLNGEEEITEVTIAKAFEVAKYFKAHMERALDQADRQKMACSDSPDEVSESLVQKIVQYVQKRGISAVNTRTIIQARLLPRLKTKHVVSAFKIMVEAGIAKPGMSGDKSIEVLH